MIVNCARMVIEQHDRIQERVNYYSFGHAVTIAGVDTTLLNSDWELNAMFII